VFWLCSSHFEYSSDFLLLPAVLQNPQCEIVDLPLRFARILSSSLTETSVQNQPTLLNVPKDGRIQNSQCVRARIKFVFLTRVDCVSQIGTKLVCAASWRIQWTLNKEVVLLPLSWGAFAKLRKTTVSFVISVRPSVCPHGRTRLPQDGFWWNLIFEFFFENLLRRFRFY
jgi:hypothetical protein